MRYDEYGMQQSLGVMVINGQRSDDLALRAVVAVHTKIPTHTAEWIVRNSRQKSFIFELFDVQKVYSSAAKEVGN